MIEEKDNSSKNKPRYKFEGKSARSQKLISVRYKVAQKKFRTGETNFYKSLFQQKLPGQADSTKLVFHVPIGSA